MKLPFFQEVLQKRLVTVHHKFRLAFAGQTGITLLIDGFCQPLSFRQIGQSQHMQLMVLGGVVPGCQNILPCKVSGFFSGGLTENRISAGIHKAFGPDGSSSADALAENSFDVSLGHGCAADLDAVENVRPCFQKQLFCQNGKLMGIKITLEAAFGYTVLPAKDGRRRIVQPNRKAQKLFCDAKAHLTPAAIAERQINGDKPQGCQTAQRKLAFQQDSSGASSGGRQGGCNACHAAANHSHIVIPCHRNFPLRFLHICLHKDTSRYQKGPVAKL